MSHFEMGFSASPEPYSSCCCFGFVGQLKSLGIFPPPRVPLVHSLR